MKSVRWTVGSNIRTGVREGLIYAAMFALVALSALLVRGPQVLSTYGLTPIELLAFYLLGGTSAGAIAGLLLPLTRHPVGAIVVGFLAMLPTCFAGVLLVFPPIEWPQLIPIAPLIGAAVYGVFGGLMLWNDHFNRH
jgi:hypothetical protein